MGKPQRQEDEESGGAPEWMVTFSDCMTLLLTFFVLLLSFASFDKETLPELGRSFAEALPSIGLIQNKEKESVWQKISTDEEVKQTEGSETPNHPKQHTSNFMREKLALDYRNLKVFCVPSATFFFGRGSAISSQGYEVLDALAIYLEHQTARVVISENGPEGNPELGLSRSQAVMDYLIQKGLDKRRFSLSAQRTTRENSVGRQLEITLLDRSVYE